MTDLVKQIVNELIPLIDRGDYEEFYRQLAEQLDKNSLRKSVVGQVTELLYQCEVDPSLHMDKIPQYYSCNLAVNDCELVVPEHINKICMGAYCRSNIKFLTLPEHLKVIEMYAFAENPIIEINIMNPKTTIKYDAFGDCRLIESIYYNGTAQQWFTQNYPKELTTDVTVHCLDTTLTYDQDGRY